MIRRIGLTACALLLLAVTAVTAQQVVTGTVVRIDQPAGVVVLDNGLMYQTTPQTIYLVNNQPAHFSMLQPGTPIVVQHGQPVVFREGRYVVMSHPAHPAGVVVRDGVYEVSGVVKYADSVRRIVRFEDGRNISIDENVQLLWNGSPVMLSTVTPGTPVVARSSRPLAYRDNTYYVATTTPVVTSTPPVVTSTPPAVVTTTPPAVAGSPITGTVVRFDQPNLIVLSDGRVIPATAQTVVMVDNRAVPYATLQPGTHVVIYPNGQGAVLYDPIYASPALKAEGGLREQEMERNAP